MILDSEDFSGTYISNFFKLGPSDFECYEKTFKSGNSSQYKNLNIINKKANYHTPDYVISNNYNDPIEELLFVDVSGPKGGLLTKAGIEIDKEIESKISRLNIGDTCSIELSKQLKPLIQGVKSKLIKVNSKYANNRDLNKSQSKNTGIIYCMEAAPVKEHHSISKNDLGSLQLSITVLELLDLLSDGKCQYSDIENIGLNKPVVFTFNKLYSNIAFIAFVGRGPLDNQSYIYVNKDFYNTSSNILASKLREMSVIDGNSFRKVRCAKSKLIIDFNISVINESNPYIFPHGNINYKGHDYKGITLEEVDLKMVNRRFDRGFK